MKSAPAASEARTSLSTQRRLTKERGEGANRRRGAAQSSLVAPVCARRLIHRHHRNATPSTLPNSLLLSFEKSFSSSPVSSSAAFTVVHTLCNCFRISSIIVAVWYCAIPLRLLIYCSSHLLSTILIVGNGKSIPGQNRHCALLAGLLHLRNSQLHCRTQGHR